MTGIETFIWILRKAGLALNDVELAESFWLAHYLPTPTTEATNISQPSSKTTKKALPARSSRHQSNLDTATPVTDLTGERALYPEIASMESQVSTRAERIRVPAAVALSDELCIGRAMRPFSRRYPSRHTFVIDEEATVQRIADGGLMTPVLRPGRERWFEVALVVEDTPSMVVWHQTAKELEQVLQTVGAFSDVRRWWLTLVDGRATLHTLGGTRHAPAELNHPSARRLIIVMTDGVSDHWKQRAFVETLAAWAKTTPVTIAHVLPERLWPQTVLGAATATIWSPGRGLPNSGLMVNSPWWNEEPLKKRIPVVPFALEPASILRCAQALMGVGASAPALFLKTGGESGDGTANTSVPNGGVATLSAQEQVERFRKIVSTQAYDLAVFFSAVPLTLPVMRVIQQAMAAGSLQEHLAEVFVGGILERVTPASVSSPPDAIEFDFLNGVREILQRALRRSEVVDVLSVVSKFVGERFGQVLDFRALIADPEGTAGLAEEARPFARIGVDLLARVLPLSRVKPRSEAVQVGLKEEYAKDDQQHSLWFHVYDLIERIKAYNPQLDEEILKCAYVFAMKAHGAQKRASGDPYFSHPLEVAGILTHYRLDVATIVTALLHDTIEDTPATLDDVQRHFGEEVARLVDGVTKLTRIELQSEQTKQAENFRKLVLAMSDDIRVLLVKLADRLHNMRTLKDVASAEKRRRVAHEALDIYAPLAERIGMQEMKDELEDLAFAEINPDARNSLILRLNFLREQGGDLVSHIAQGLRGTLAEAGLRAAVLGREKTPYSIWHKMQRKNIGFEQLADVTAFRIIVDSIEDCYRALGLVHEAYPVIPGRFKDFISMPKSDGYRSLHTGVLGPSSQRMEIQIRTREMHEVAEYGVAAHWNKQGLDSNVGRQYRWLRELLDILDHAAGPEEFLEHTKLEMFQDQVFCFTPKGDLISLPSNSTPVDFAYAVHSEIGDTCVGAKINGRLMPLRTPLQNGDQVEIITSKAQTPSPTWERFVVTGKARRCIRRFIRSKEREQYLQFGRSLIERGFREEGYEYYDKALEGVLKNFKQATVEDLLSQVGAGYITARTVVESVFPGSRRRKSFYGKLVPLARARQRPAKKETESALPIRGLIPGVAVHLASCCHPLPGDRIVGIVTTGKGVIIHTIDCEALESYSDAPERWTDVSWQIESDEPTSYVGRIHLTVLNGPGTLDSLMGVVERNEGNIANMKISRKMPDFYDLDIYVKVRDVKHLFSIIKTLQTMRVVISVDRN